MFPIHSEQSITLGCKQLANGKGLAPSLAPPPKTLASKALYPWTSHCLTSLSMDVESSRRRPSWVCSGHKLKMMREWCWPSVAALNKVNFRLQD